MTVTVGYDGTMGSRLVLGVLVASACNGAHLKDGEGIDAPNPPRDGSNSGSDSGMPDAPVDAYVLGAWSAPNGVPGAAVSTQNIDDETLNSMQTEIYFGIVDATLGVKQLWMMSRLNAQDQWGQPVKLDATFNVGGATPPTEESPRLSVDDKTIYFGRGGDIYYATRSAVGSPWSTPAVLAGVSTAQYEKWFAPCAGNYYLVSRSISTGGAQRLYEGQLGGTDSLSTLAATTGNDIASFLSADCKMAYWASNRGGTTQLYTATRSAAGAAWGATTELTMDFGVASDNEDPWLSSDQRTFYFSSQRFGGSNTNKGVYYSTR